MIKKCFALSIIAASVAVVGCSSDSDPVVVDAVVLPDVTPDAGGSAYDTIAASTSHSTLKSAIDSITDLNKKLDNPASVFTIFAPTNAAFDAFVAADTDDAFNTVGDLLIAANQAALIDILNYHVVAPAVANTPLTSTDISDNLNDGDATNNTLATLLADATLTIAATTTTPAATSGADVVDSDGTVVALNDVDQGLADPITGIVHFIDAVLTPPAPVTPPATPPGGTPPVTSGDVDTILAGLGTVEIFRAAISRDFGTNLDDSPWTVFVPSDATLDAASLTDLTVPQQQDHIVSSGAFDPAALGALTEITASSSAVYAVAVDAGGTITVNGNVVELIATGAGGAQIYSTSGILAAP